MRTLYKTSDLALAAALITAGHVIESLNKADKHRVSFHFCASPDIEQTVGLFWSDKLELPVRSYFENIKMIKTRIYDQ